MDNDRNATQNQTQIQRPSPPTLGSLDPVVSGFPSPPTNLKKSPIRVYLSPGTTSQPEDPSDDVRCSPSSATDASRHSSQQSPPVSNRSSQQSRGSTKTTRSSTRSRSLSVGMGPSPKASGELLLPSTCVDSAKSANDPRYSRHSATSSKSKLHSSSSTDGKMHRHHHHRHHHPHHHHYHGKGSSQNCGYIQYLRKAHAAPDRHDHVALRVILRTALILGLAFFVICIVGTVLLNILFSSLRYTVTSSKATPHPYIKEYGNGYLFLAVIFAMVSCVLSVIGTVFLNLMVQCVTSYVNRSGR